VRSDGRRVVVSLTISPIRDEAGTVIGASKIVRDITQRKELENSLRRLAADLSEANRRKDEFLAMLAHELRNPLAPISNAVQVLRMGESDRGAVEKVGALLERQVGQLARLVDDLLDMSRITRGQIELRKERTDLARVIHQAVEAAQTWCSAMNHNLTVTQPMETLTVNADPARLAQVIGNLLNNACKFTDRGGQIHLIAERDGDQAVIRVRDNGIGITPEQHSRIFDMFTQLDTSLERSHEGLGIGLTLVKTLVEQHGGTVSVSSEGVGRGSEFVVRLPLLVEPLPEETQWTQAQTDAVGRRRILIVDDNADSAQSLAMLLELSGHEMYTAGDGIEGLALAEQLRPDVVLLDIGLPRLNGYEVCRRIRQQPWGREMVIAALTGWGQEEDRHRSKEAGFTTHLVKPVDVPALLKLLGSLPGSEAGVSQGLRT
jgi:signal transduction histidine kinase/ActR/RegA family two-component response regulator